MANVFDYLDKRGDFSIEESPLSEVDYSIFSHLSTPDFSGIVPSDTSTISLSDAIKVYLDSGRIEKLGKFQPGKLSLLLEKLCLCKRFSNLKLSFERSRVSDTNMEQFGAVSIILPNDTVCLSFKGTDDSIIGWKENCYMAVLDKIPAQIEAVKYLTDMSERFSGKIIALGHSKGGNLAVFSSCSVKKEIRNRIVSVYNFDGPGFYEDFFFNEAYQEMRNRITTVLTQNSMVGVLMNRPGNIVYAKSPDFGPFAHDSLKWLVSENLFLRSEGLSKASVRFERIINSTIHSIGKQELQCFVDSFFDVLQSKGAETITDLSNMGAMDFIKILLEMNGEPRIKEFNRILIKAITKEYLSIF